MQAPLWVLTIFRRLQISCWSKLCLRIRTTQYQNNAIAPGLFRTDFAKALWENPEILKQSTATCPMKRIGEPDEIGGAAVFLASEAGSFVNGHTLVIDGGTVV